MLELPGGRRRFPFTAVVDPHVIHGVDRSLGAFGAAVSSPTDFFLLSSTTAGDNKSSSEDEIANVNL